MYLLFVIRKNSLGIKSQTKLSSGNNFIIHQISANLFIKLCVLPKILEYSIYQNFIDGICIRILVSNIQLCGVYPVIGNTSIKIIPQADFITFPRKISIAVGVNAVPLYNSNRLTREIGVNINHICHHVSWKIFHYGSMWTHQLLPKLF